MLKNYFYNGRQFQYEEGSQPEGAVEVKAVEPPRKETEPKSKAVKPANKARKAVSKK
jgi:hypothetical protein